MSERTRSHHDGTPVEPNAADALGYGATRMPGGGFAPFTPAPAVVGGTAMPIDAVTEMPPPVEFEAEPPRGAELVGKLLAGRYRIDALLGSGGMGAVYRAEHVHMRKGVAIKVLHKEMTYLPEAVQRFEREAIAAANIEHPNVAAAKDFGRLEDGSCYLVLEFVEGQSLSKLLRDTPRLDVGRALRITRQVADALTAAHALGIVHRDLKPDNVMLVARAGDPDFVKVLDFGIAKVRMAEPTSGAAAKPLTQVGSVFGTPEYMAPEQAAGADVDPRGDLYTLGIILYEMLAGTTPFRKDDILAMLTAQMTQEPPALPTDVPYPVQELVFRLLRKQRDERIGSATELVARVDQIAADLGYAGVPASVARPTMGTSGTLLALGPSSGNTAPAITASALTSLSLQALQRPVMVAGQPVPTWTLAAVGVAAGGVLLVGLLGVVTLAVWKSNGKPTAEPLPSASASASVTASADATAPTVAIAAPAGVDAALLARASGGDPAALAQVEQRARSARSPAEWAALARGYGARARYSEAMEAYGRALESVPDLARERSVALQVRRAADDKNSREAALDVAADRLGAVGVDILFDVWREANKVGDKKGAALAWNRLQRPDVEAHAAPGAAAAIALWASRDCNARKNILETRLAQLDDRSVPVLKAMGDKNGCGSFFSRSDCWACVRPIYPKAMAAALAKKGPSFE